MKRDRKNVFYNYIEYMSKLPPTNSRVVYKDSHETISCIDAIKRNYENLEKKYISLIKALEKPTSDGSLYKSKVRVINDDQTNYTKFNANNNASKSKIVTPASSGSFKHAWSNGGRTKRRITRRRKSRKHRK
jgi:trans-2-enoyl-CoA reductase